MGIVDRVKNICLSPNTEWPVIAGEAATPGGLVTGYALPLMAIGAIAGFIGGSIIGYSVFGSTFRTPIGAGIVGLCLMIVMGLIGLFLLAFLINALAPTFGGQQNFTQAMKVAVYSYTPAWVAGVLNVIPFLGMLAILGALYGLYLLYLGLPSLMKSPQDKSMGYTVVVVICAIVLSVVTTAVVGIIGLGAAGAGALAGSGAFSSDASSNDVQFDKDSPLGRLQEMGKAMEKSGAEMEAAQKAGDGNAAATAAMSTLGALLGGGRKVEPLELDQLKSFVPDTFAGLAKQGDGRAEKNGLGGLSVSEVEARYSDGADKSVTLEITDSGGASGLMGMASWAAMASEKSDDSGSEKTSRVNGRMTHERDAKDGTDEFSVVVGERFMVSAKSADLGLPALKAAVASLNLSKLESMKDVGVQKP